MNKKSEKMSNEYLSEEMHIDMAQLKALKKKLAKIQPRSERGVETLFKLLSKNQYTLNTIIDRKSNILITVNALILTLVLSIMLNQLHTYTYLIYPAIAILTTNLVSIVYAIFATRPNISQGKKGTRNLMYFGDFDDMDEEEYINQITSLMYKGDELYRTIASDTYHLGIILNKKFAYLRKSFNVFLLGLIISVIAFLISHVFFGGQVIQ